MKSVHAYRRHLRQEDDWRSYLLDNSGLPGSRANTALAAAVAEEGDRALFGTLASVNAETAPNTPEEFLMICGVVGVGRLIADGDETLLPTLRTFAFGTSPHMQEAVALALQHIARQDLIRMLDIADEWLSGTYLEARAVVAALSDPRFYDGKDIAARTLTALDRATAAAMSAPGEVAVELRSLREALRAAWRIALQGAPESATAHISRWTDQNPGWLRGAVQPEMPLLP